MRILNVPEHLQQPFHRYPPHENGPGLERGFFSYCTRKQATINTRAIYIPALWTNNYHAQAKANDLCCLSSVKDAQRLLGSLSPNRQYFTVVQCDDGIYEQVPPNLFVFSSGGVGDEPIPLLSSPHPYQVSKKDLLASFVGNFEVGGPVKTYKHCSESSWDKDGPGALVRRKMQKVFQDHSDCLLLPSQGSGKTAIRIYRDTAKRSWFGLSPRGYGKTSFRLYEMMSIGAIPVYIYDDPWLPYQDKVDWESFCVLCHRSDLASLYNSLQSTSIEWRQEALQQGRRLLTRWFTLQATCQQVARMVQEKWPCE